MCLLLASSVCMHIAIGRSQQTAIEGPTESLVSALWALCFKTPEAVGPRLQLLTLGHSNTALLLGGQACFHMCIVSV